MTQFEHTERLKQTADLLEQTAEGLERAAANLNSLEKLVAEALFGTTHTLEPGELLI